MLRRQSTLRPDQPRNWSMALVLVCAAHTTAAGLTLPSVTAANESRIDMTEAGVRREEIRTKVVGDYYFSTTTKRVPGIILLGGSDGEPMRERSALLATQGFAVLNLFYFGHSSLPKEFAKVPVEYLTNAVSWLRGRKEVYPARIAVIGHSRGAEAALLTATFCPDVRAVVAVAPSSVVWPGPGASGYFHSAWSLHGKELPYVPVKFSKGVGAFLKAVTVGTQIEQRPLFEDALKNTRAVEQATIHVENIRGAVLLISGKNDRVWPSAPMAERIVAQLQEHHHAFTYRHLSYENAGHSFGLPNQLRTNNLTRTYKMGGTMAGNGAAATNSWKATLEFLETELRKRGGDSIDE
jgi:dienelactone hydrolase